MERGLLRLAPGGWEQHADVWAARAGPAVQRVRRWAAAGQEEGTGLSPLTQVQREVDGAGVLHPGQHGLALPPGGVGLVVVVGQEGCPVLQVGLPGVAQVTGLGDAGHPGLHTVLLGRSPARVGGHHGHVEGGVDELGHAALRSPALVRALVHGRPDAAGRRGQHGQHRPESRPGPQRPRGPLAARHPAAQALGHGSGKGAFLPPGGVPRRPRPALSVGAGGGGGSRWEDRPAGAAGEGRAACGPLTAAPRSASAPPSPTRDAACTRRRPPTSERVPARARAPGKEDAGGGVGGLGWGGVGSGRAARPTPLSWPQRPPRAVYCASAPATRGGVGGGGTSRSGPRRGTGGEGPAGARGAGGGRGLQGREGRARAGACRGAGGGSGSGPVHAGRQGRLRGAHADVWVPGPLATPVWGRGQRRRP